MSNDNITSLSHAVLDWAANVGLIVALVFLVGCSNGSSSETQVQPGEKANPSKFLNVIGHLDPRFKADAIIATYAPISVVGDCARTSWPSGVRISPTKSVSIPLHNRGTYVEARVVLDKYLAGLCDWTLRDVQASITSPTNDHYMGAIAKVSHLPRDFSDTYYSNTERESTDIEKFVVIGNEAAVALYCNLIFPADKTGSHTIVYCLPRRPEGVPIISSQETGSISFSVHS